MREILFRGKRLDNGEWILGALYDGAHFTVIADEILQSDWDKSQDNFRIYGKQVNLETVGQYTGIDDVHGNKVFEGDIVKVHDNMIGVEDGAEDFIGVVYYRDGSFMIITPYQLHYRWMDYTVEVIGNKFDNPEIWEEL